MKQLILLISTITLLSCNHSTQPKETNNSKTDNVATDTILVEIENDIDTPSKIGFYSKSYTYCWVIGKDTLDLKIGLEEYVRDSSVQIRVFNQHPILFTTVIDKINECLPLIRGNFELDNLRSLYFEPPIFYKDLTNELTQDYKNQVGQRDISTKQLDEFLKNSWLEEKIGSFLKQFDKTTRTYGIEKFHLLQNQHYNQYIQNVELSEYPEFSLNGIGISVILK